MSSDVDARFWDRASCAYARSAVEDEAGYRQTLDRCRALLKPTSRVLELGCGTGTTAIQLSGSVRSYLATDISRQMIALAQQKPFASDEAWPLFRVATAETLAREDRQYEAVLGFNYLHLVRDLPHTLKCVHSLVAPAGLFISKTPCLAEMHPLFRMLLLPAMRAIGKAPYARALREQQLGELIAAAGFEILHVENHASVGNDHCPFIVARKC